MAEQPKQSITVGEMLDNIVKGRLLTEELDKLDMRKIYKRRLERRIFVNRSLRLDKIHFFGFDMDYTLAIYKSPEYEELEYQLTIERLIQMGYPRSITSLKYDPEFPIRGLFLDHKKGNFLKIDNFGNIAACVHGRNVVPKKVVAELYPSLRIHNDEIGTRFYLLNTLFTLPEACLYADLVNHFESMKAKNGENASPTKETTNSTTKSNIESDVDQKEHIIYSPEMDISYSNLFFDIRNAIEYVHTENGPLKKKTLEDLPKYIVRTEKLSILLNRLKEAGRVTFLLTNSPWYYTNKVMSFLLDGFNPKYSHWREYFDHVIVGASKPAFFMEGTTLREVDVTTGNLKIGHVSKTFKKGCVYQGGNLDIFEKLAGVQNGDNVLYIGDHIFADIIISKKKHGWRTLLVVPELKRELRIWKEVQPLYQRLLKLELLKSEMYRDMDYEAVHPPDTSLIRRHMNSTINELNASYNKLFGSLFRSGLKLSFFGMQVQRYADLYTSDYYNLLNYPMFYYFSPTASLMPHESAEEVDIITI
jgi:5'-nucleotidase